MDVILGFNHRGEQSSPQRHGGGGVLGQGDHRGAPLLDRDGLQDPPLPRLPLTIKQKGKY